MFQTMYIVGNESPWFATRRFRPDDYVVANILLRDGVPVMETLHWEITNPPTGMYVEGMIKSALAESRRESSKPSDATTTREPDYTGPFPWYTSRGRAVRLSIQ